jgi:ATP-binding cassette subfamily B protein
MHPPIPRKPDGDATWRTRLASLRNIRPLLGMVWSTSPPLVSVTVAMRLVRAMLPLAMLWVSKLILDAVVAWIKRGNGNATHLWKLVALELGLAVLSDLLARANSLADSLLGDRFTNRISVRLIEHATQLDLASFEDPVFYDKLERARRQTTGRIGLLAAVLNVGQDTLSLISLSVGLIVFSPWLMVLLIAAVIPAFLGETHFTTLAYSVLYRWTPQRRLLDYIRLLGASSQSAKEVKIFGLGGHLSERYREVSDRIYEDNKKVAVKRAGVGFLLNLISTGGYYGAYAVVLIRTLAGAISVGTFTFLTGAFSRSRSYIERILQSFTDISDQALYLKDLFEFFEMQPAIRSAPSALPAPRPMRDGFEFRNVGWPPRKKLRLSAKMEPARPPSSSCSPGSTIQRPARSCSMAWTSASMTWKTSAKRSG